MTAEKQVQSTYRTETLTEMGVEFRTYYVYVIDTSTARSSSCQQVPRGIPLGY